MRLTRPFAWGLLVWVAVLVWSCGSGRSTDRLHELEADYWEWRLQSSPLFATSVGDSSYSDRLDDFSPEAFAERQTYRLDLLQSLEAVRWRRLSQNDRITYDLLHRELQAAIDLYALNAHLLPVTPSSGPHIDLHRLAYQTTFETAADYQAYLARLEQVPRYLEQTATLLREGIAARVVMPGRPMQEVLGSIREQFEVRPDQSPFYFPFNNLPESLSRTGRRELRQQALAIITDQIMPAFELFHQVMTREYLPACRTNIGLAALPQGEQWYNTLVKWHTTTDMTAEQIHQLAHQEVGLLEAQIDSVVGSVGFPDDRNTFAWSLQNSPSLFHRSSRALLRGYRNLLDQLEPQLPMLFGRLPAAPLEVVATPAQLALELEATAYALADSGAKGQLLVNTLYFRERPMWNMEAQALRNGLPGRHLQEALAWEQPGQTAYRRWTAVPAFTAGWALYAESLGPELGFYQDANSGYGWLTHRLRAAVRVVVDTGIHSLGWDRQTALDYLAAHTTLPAHRMAREINNLSADPGRALAGWAGATRIAELRREAARQLGDSFDIREFHDTILMHGPQPLENLSRAVADYIKQK